MTVAECREVLAEAEWEVLEGPSAFYTGAPIHGEVDAVV